MTAPVASGAGSAPVRWIDDAAQWSEGRLWHWRLPILAALAWIGVRHLAEPEYWSIFMGLTLAKRPACPQTSALPEGAPA